MTHKSLEQLLKQQPRDRILMPNGDVHYRPQITDDERYFNIELQSDGYMILHKLSYITIPITNLHNYKLSSTILKCLINNIPILKPNYTTLLKHLYVLINDKDKIIEHSTLKNISLVDKSNYTFLEQVGIYIPNTIQSHKRIIELHTQCIKNNFTLNLNIKLLNNTIINIVL